MIRRVVGTLGLIAVAAAGLGLATGFAQAQPAAPQVANATAHITVAASEFKFVFSKRSVPVGTTVIFTVVNKGKIAHNFSVVGTSISTQTPTLAPGKTASITVTFLKNGRYTYLCTIPGHAAAGMKGTLVVK